jgi:hypothetical protein
LTTHIEFENTGNHDNGLRPISVLEHCKPERLSTIDEESAAEAARVPNNPFSSAVLANEKERRSRTRGRPDLFHAILRDSLNDGPYGREAQRTSDLLGSLTWPVAFQLWLPGSVDWTR